MTARTTPPVDPAMPESLRRATGVRIFPSVVRKLARFVEEFADEAQVAELRSVIDGWQPRR